MNDRNLLKGLWLALIALVFGLGSLNYPVGRLERAGPGFFPLLVSAILMLLAISMIIRSRFTEKVPVVFNYRNLGIILASLAAFALVSRWVNMTAGIVVLVFVSSIAASSHSWKRNFLVAGVLLGIAFVFVKGLGLQLPLL